MSDNIFIQPSESGSSIKILIYLFVIGGILIVISKHSEIINNWNDDNVRCNPVIMATAPLYNKNIFTNSKYCMSNTFKRELSSEMSNIIDKTKNFSSKNSDTQSKISTMNTQHMATKGMFTGLLQNVNNVFANLLINIKRDALKGGSMIRKFGGLVTSILYVIQGGSMTGTSFINGPIYKIISKIGKIGACFQKNVKLKLKTGEYKKVYKLKINDVLNNGSVIIGLVKLSNIYKEPFYTFIDNNDILITGSHLIQFNNKFINTEDHPCSVQTDIIDDTVYNIITSDHLIKIGNYTFWDYND